MTGIKALLPLLAAAGVLLAGNGMQGTLIALRADIEGFSTIGVGIMGAAYYAGFLIACVVAPRMLQAVGHIRVFAALCAIAAIGTLALAITISPLSWAAIRFIMGFCFSGLFTAIESWLNASAHPEQRARLLSLYRIIDLCAVTGAQYLIPAFGAGGFAIFSIMAMLFCLSLVPVSLSDRTNPAPPEDFHFDLKALWVLSPLACMSCLSIGLTNSAFRLISPLYARDIGLDEAGIATFISAGIAGGVLLQYPLGYLSDRINRRWAIGISTSGAVAAGLFMSLVAKDDALLNLAGIFLFGAFAMPIYSLSAAHANAKASQSQYVLVAAGLMFFFSAGAIVGPLVASMVMERYGASALFIYTSAIHGFLMLFTGFRQVRGPEAGAPRGRFVALLRTSPFIYRLAQRNDDSEQPTQPTQSKPGA
ncbi:MAG: MFS transporter [Tepidamorphaceae bacterium]|nr:MFS transporter [Rhodobiaceae bacterium]